MAIGREWREAITEILSAPPTMMEHIERRLGEADLVPRGPRGVNAPHYEWAHGARLLLGGMATLADAASPASRVAPRTAIIGRMRPSGATVDIVPPGPFEAAVAHILEALAYTKSADSVRNDVQEIALMWERDALFGLIRLTPRRFEEIIGDALVYEPLDNPPGAYRDHFLKPPVLAREARLSSHALFRLVTRINRCDSARLGGRAPSETGHPGTTPGSDLRERAKDAASAPKAQPSLGLPQPNDPAHEEGQPCLSTFLRKPAAA